MRAMQQQLEATQAVESEQKHQTTESELAEESSDCEVTKHVVTPASNVASRTRARNNGFRPTKK